MRWCEEQQQNQFNLKLTQPSCFYSVFLHSNIIHLLKSGDDPSKTFYSHFLRAYYALFGFKIVTMTIKPLHTWRSWAPLQNRTQEKHGRTHKSPVPTNGKAPTKSAQGYRNRYRCSRTSRYWIYIAIMYKLCLS